MFIAIFLVINHNMDKEYQKYGYSSWTDNIKYEEWTGEIIPKSEIDSYTSNNKYITNSKGERVSVIQIETLINKYKEIQGSYACFNEEQKDSLDVICDILLRQYLDLNYKIEPYGEENSHRYRFQIVGEYENNYYADFQLLQI